MINTTTVLVIGRGSLYFGRFAAGTKVSDGELHLGNTPGFSVVRQTTEIERKGSYKGQQIQLEAHQIGETYSANIITDHINMDNMALWFGAASVEKSGQIAEGLITETFIVKKGLHYQLGLSREIMGVRYVEPNIVFKKAGVPIAATGNLNLDREEGRFQVDPGADDILSGDTITATFEWRTSKSTVIEPDVKEIIGSLRFVSHNAVGPEKHYFFPYVVLKPAGAMDLKMDQFQQFSFALEARKLNPLTNYVYIREIGSVGNTDDEKAILDEGLTFDEFMFLENELDQIINVIMPSRGY